MPTLHLEIAHSILFYFNKQAQIDVTQGADIETAVRPVEMMQRNTGGAGEAILTLLELIQAQPLGAGAQPISVKGHESGGSLPIEVYSEQPDRLTAVDYHLPVLLEALPKMHRFGGNEAQVAPTFTILFNLLTVLILERPMLLVSDDQ